MRCRGGNDLEISGPVGEKYEWVGMTEPPHPHSKWNAACKLAQMQRYSSTEAANVKQETHLETSRSRVDQSAEGNLYA